MVKRLNLATMAFCASFFALGVIALGAFTRLIDAGLGCPDWPGCYGQMVVSASEPHIVVYKAWAEMIHRYFVGALSFFIVSIVLLIFSCKKYRQVSNMLLASGLVLLLIYQIILGRWTVTLKLLPIIVTQHLLGGFFILSLLWIIFLNNSATPLAGHRKILPWAVVGLVLLIVQISLGAWTSTNYASLSCPDFPFCTNSGPWLPMELQQAFNLFGTIGVNYEGGVLPEIVRQTIQMTHRVGALVILIYFLVFIGLAQSRLKNQIPLLKLLYLMLALLILQISLGISNIIFQLPLATAIAHNLTAVLLLLSLLTFIFKLSKVR